MNIVFVVDHYNAKTDGTIITTRRFEEELTRQGHNVTIISCGVNGKNKCGLKENKIPIVSTIAKKSNVIFAKFNKKIIKQALMNADLVHLLLPFSVERKTLKLAKKLGVPVTAAFHLHPDNILKNIGMKKIPRFLTKLIFWYWRTIFYNKIEHIHCPSQFTADELIKHKYKSTLHVISNGVAPHFIPANNGYLPQSKALDSCLAALVPQQSCGVSTISFKNEIISTKCAERKFEILMVGRLATEKRQDLLIKAVEGSKYKDRINITFAGSGPLKKKYIKMSDMLLNKPTFEFLTQDQLLEKIHSSDLYVHAADVEIEGISCIEAFACGLVPVIGNADKSAAKQFIIDPRCEFEAGNAVSLREKIEYWIENPHELKQLGEKYSAYAQLFSLEKSVSRTVDMFETAITR